MAKQQEILGNKAVQVAEKRGFIAFGENSTSRRHFHWFMPDADIHGDHKFSVHQYAGCSSGELSYRVDDQGTTSVEQAIKWLMKIRAIKS